MYTKKFKQVGGTIYGFRSSGEIAWAEYWNRGGIEFLYEPQRFTTRGNYGKNYTPDFKIGSCFFEIKNQGFNKECAVLIFQMLKANQAVRDYGIELYLVEGLPENYRAFRVDGSMVKPSKDHGLVPLSALPND